MREPSARPTAMTTNPTAPIAIAVLLSDDKSADQQLQVLSAARLARTKKFRALASKRLKQLASAKSEGVRRQARAGLVALRAPEVVPLLQQGLGSTSEQGRIQAAVGLFVMEHPGAAATALADERRRVRTQVACAILARR